MALNTVQVDPMKYLSDLPIYDGNCTNLYTFIDLIDRIGSVLETYDDFSKAMFLDMIRAKLKGPAKDIAEINNHLTNWTELREVLVNNFGDRLSVEQLFDEMRSLRFKTNAKNFYDEIVIILRRLNMKTRIVHGNEVGYSTLIAANKRTALEIFKNKLVEPMRSIIVCRNPNNIENALKILFDTNYAYFNPNPNQIKHGYDNRVQGVKGNLNRDRNSNRNRNGNQYNYQNHTDNTCHGANANYNKGFYLNENRHQNSFLPNRNGLNQNTNHNQFTDFQSGNRGFNRVRDSDQARNERPVPMEVGNFHRGPSTSSLT